MSQHTFWIHFLLFWSSFIQKYFCSFLLMYHYFRGAIPFPFFFFCSQRAAQLRASIYSETTEFFLLLLLFLADVSRQRSLPVHCDGPGELFSTALPGDKKPYEEQ